MVVDSVIPLPGDTGVARDQKITVAFKVEADPDSVIDAGTFVVTTAAKKLVSFGPGMEDFIPQDDAFDILKDDVFRGMVEGTVTTDDNISFVFTPKYDLEPHTEYTILLSADMTDRTIDPVVEITSTGTGELTHATGPFTGAAADSYTVVFSLAGPLGVAKFRYMDAALQWSAEMVAEAEVEAKEGVTFHFAEGDYEVADSWSVGLIAPVPLGRINSFSFTTGVADELLIERDQQSIEIKEAVVDGLLRIDSETTMGGVAGGAPTAAHPLVLVSSVPADLDSNLPLSTDGVTLVFSMDIDPLTVTEENIRAFMETLPFYPAQESIQLKVGLEIIDPRTIKVRFIG